MGVSVVQRHTLPLIASLMSRSVGAGLRVTSAVADMIRPA
jgi:hypothetical protein